MKDLVCLVADKDIEATMNGILTRHQALGICPIEFEVLVHPQRDPGCFHRPEPLLESYRAWARYALIVFDQAWTGAPAGGGIETERLLEKRLRDRNMAEWARSRSSLSRSSRSGSSLTRHMSARCLAGKIQHSPSEPSSIGGGFGPTALRSRLIRRPQWSGLFDRWGNRDRRPSMAILLAA
jgi:hypothetical protein